MYKTVEFNEQQKGCNPTYQGRNGTGKCHGVEVFNFEGLGRLRLTPLNSKGELAKRSGIDVPVSAARELCAAIEEISGLAKSEELIQALWYFIENVSDDDPERNEKFFKLRGQVRKYTWAD